MSLGTEYMEYNKVQIDTWATGLVRHTAIFLVSGSANERAGSDLF